MTSITGITICRLWLSSFNSGQGLVSISTNGALYFTSYRLRTIPRVRPTSSSNYYMIAGLWEDLRTDRRAVMMYTLFNLILANHFSLASSFTFDTQLGLALQGRKSGFLRDRIAT